MFTITAKTAMIDNETVKRIASEECWADTKYESRANICGPDYLIDVVTLRNGALLKFAQAMYNRGRDAQRESDAKLFDVTWNGDSDTYIDTEFSNDYAESIRNNTGDL